MDAATHRRVVVRRRGGPEVLTVVEEPLPQPPAGQVRVATLAAGISGMDLMVRQHRFPGFPSVPFTPGVDVVGRVDAIGDGVTDLERGQTVAALLGTQGGYAEAVCVAAEDAVPVPDGVDPAEAVCLVANHLTAYSMAHRTAQVRSGERALVHGAAGGVGTALLEVGRLAGLEMYGTASAYNHELVRSLGATPIDYHTEDFVERVRELTGDGVDVVFDPIGGARQLWRSYRTLRPGGRLVWFGVAGTARNGIGVIPASLITRLLLSLIPDGRAAPMPPDSSEPNDWYRHTLALLLDHLAAGKLAPVVAARFPIVEAADAHRYLQEGRHAGRVVLVTAE
jgi:NADPH2:quinone reductase